MKNSLKTLLFLLLLFIVWQSLNSATSTSNNNATPPVCPEGNGWVKVEGTNPSYIAPSGVIKRICVMGGGFRHYFKQDGTTPYKQLEGPGQGQDEVVSDCWGVTGISTNSGEAWKNDKHSEGFCPDISHASFKVKVVDPHPICGGYATNYTHDVNDWPAQGEFCEIGEPDPENPVFPAPGGITTWDCIIGGNMILTREAVNDIKKVTCEATRDEKPEEEPTPVCGGYADHYTHDINDWPAQGEFCEVGESDPENPVFPAQGESTTWNCTSNSKPVVCEATRGEEELEEDEPEEEVLGVGLGPEIAVLGVATVAVTDTSGGSNSTVIAMQVILLLSLVSAIWTYLEDGNFSAVLSRKR
jgi:hypothetical protein